MRRREFIALIGGVTPWPLVARAQSVKIWRMGFIAHGNEIFYGALFEGLRDYGYVEGQNLIVERRFARGNAALFKDFAAAFATIAQERPDALLVLQDAVTMQQRGDITDFAMHERLPSMFQEKGWAQAGGLMSYGEDLAAMYRRAAFYVDRIFKGANPADLPVEQATKFELAINLKTAKAIGLTFPDRILAVADPVIE